MSAISLSPVTWKLPPIPHLANIGQGLLQAFCISDMRRNYIQSGITLVWASTGIHTKLGPVSSMITT